MTGQEHINEVKETIYRAQEHAGGSTARAVLLIAAQESVFDFIKAMGPTDIYTAKRMVALVA